MALRVRLLLILIAIVPVFLCQSFGQSYKYFRLGHAEDAETKPISGFALMGGGADLDVAFRWLCERAAGGDILVVRARGDDDYDPYINGLCKANSVATLIVPDKAAAEDPHVAEIIRRAEAIFIAGGDQANYINHWTNTAMQLEMNAAIARGVPVGGTSAGLAVMGEFLYSAQGDAPDDKDLSSAMALANPFHPRVTVRRNFLDISILKDTLTDTHFRKRDRMGRSLAFLSRIVQDGWSANPREIAVEERAAVLLEPSGAATVVGFGPVYFLRVTEAPSVCRPNEPLSIAGIAVHRVDPNGKFDVADWRGPGGIDYELRVNRGKISSSAQAGAVY
jgi:cyanophycinase